MKVIARWVNFSTILLLCFFGLVYADEFHYNNLLIGDRASGMAGAYTAIADDASGMYYNPAGITYVTDKNFAASVNAYSSQIKTYDNVIGGQPFVRTSNALLANYFGIVKPVGAFKFGFSYAVPDAVNEDLSQIVKNVSSNISNYDFTINLNIRDNTYNVGPSLAAAINKDLSLGITLYVHQRNTLIIQNQFLARIDATNQWTNSYFQLSESGVRPIVGLTWSPLEKFSLGVALSKTFLLSSRASRQDTCVDTSTPANCGSSATLAFPFRVPTVTYFDAKRKYPTRATLGAAYFYSSNLLLSADVTSHTAVVDPVFGDKVATLDAALGMEYYLSKKWALRTGVFSNVANTPNIQAGVTSIEEHINLFGGSMSMTHFTGDSSVTLGGSLSYGVGQAQIGTPSTDVQRATTFGWTLFLSSSY
jgi:long-chain fatty acid transport protein